MKGQALTSLIIVMFIGLAVITTAMAVIDNNYLSVSGLIDSHNAYVLAESGLEDSLLRLLRNPSFSGSTLTTPDGTATITLTPGTPTILTSVGVSGRHTRTVEARVVFLNGIMTVQSWKEI